MSAIYLQQQLVEVCERKRKTVDRLLYMEVGILSKTKFNNPQNALMIIY